MCVIGKCKKKIIQCGAAQDAQSCEADGLVRRQPDLSLVTCLMTDEAPSSHNEDHLRSWPRTHILSTPTALLRAKPASSQKMINSDNIKRVSRAERLQQLLLPVRMLVTPNNPTIRGLLTTARIGQTTGTFPRRTRTILLS